MEKNYKAVKAMEIEENVLTRRDGEEGIYDMSEFEDIFVSNPDSLKSQSSSENKLFATIKQPHEFTNNINFEEFSKNEKSASNISEALPNFPEFRLFTFDDISWYGDFYLDNNLSPYADLSPDDILIWLNYNDDLMISRLDDTVILFYTNVLDNNRINVIPLASSLSDSVLEKIMTYLKEKKLPAELREIPSVICSELDDNKWLLEDDQNSFEYILDTQQQSSLNGSEFSRQRRRIKFFDRNHANDRIDIQYYQEINDAIKADFLNYIDTVPFNSSDEATAENCTEPVAIRRNLDYAPSFHKKALIIRINGVIVSLSLISYLDEKSVAINHLKVNYSVQYIFQYTIYQLAKIFDEEGIPEMNIEQDLGIEGLRIFKERLHPSRFLEKKIIRPRYL